MFRLINAEFKKLFTIRSTYIFLAFCVLILVFFAFYIEGFKPDQNITDGTKLAREVINAVSNLATFFALIGILLVTHEYRYNTIMYTLTSSNNRLKVFFAKIIAISIFAVIASLVFGALSPLLAALGIHLKGLEMVPQSIPYLDLLWRVALYGWGYTMLGLVFAFILRNQVGAIVALLFIPGPVEALLGLLLKNNVVYLPYTALTNVLGIMVMPGQTAMSHGKAALIASIYIMVGGIVSAVSFIRRDAN